MTNDMLAPYPRQFTLPLAFRVPGTVDRFHCCPECVTATYGAFACGNPGCSVNQSDAALYTRDKRMAEIAKQEAERIRIAEIHRRAMARGKQ